MEYSVNKLARLAGISTRTLRYYDEIELLTPKRISSNGYRIYGEKEVDLLQQIMFYRELGMPLEEIRMIMQAKNYDSTAALQKHLLTLKAKKEQIDLLIATIEKTIAAAKGDNKMSDKEKFEGFKRKMIEDNEAQYGEEIRKKYGDAEVDAANAKLQGMSNEEYEKVQALANEVNEALKAAFKQGDPAGELAQKACQLHKEWLCYYWNGYSKEAHLVLTQSYVDDPRFKKYYDAIEEGCAEFLYSAMQIYCK